jgi:crotonobetainyl-CoA:carnitine CoA-transferase CaiB-like acyl-CoA transferase
MSSIGPLSGIRVLDLTSVVSGPAAMVTLADQGADVIKVEPLTGDIMRAVRGSGGSGLTPNFISCNRGKRSVAIDLKNPKVAPLLWQLIESADVFAQNFRPGAIERLGFGADQVMKRNPRLVYLSISGVGETGPYASKRVYDPVIQSISGLADIQADPTTGRPKMVRTLIADKTTAIYAAQAVTAALLSRASTGRGQHVRVSMLDVMMSYLWPEGMAPFSLVADGTQDVTSSAHDMIFPTSDGYITLGAISNNEWLGLCTALEKPEWIEDPRFSTPAARAANRQERLECVEQALGGRDTATIIAALEANDVPCAPVLKRRAVIDHPQVVNNEIVHTIDHQQLGEVRQARAAARFEDTPSHIPREAPLLGEHSRQVLLEMGISESECDALVSAGALHDASATN